MTARLMAAASRLIVALDAGTLPAALRLAKPLQGLVRYVKIGSVLFTAEGPRAVQRLQRLGFGVFLDLKFYDIPSTVEKSCRAAARHGVWMLTVHASGEPAMLEAAVAGARQEAAARRVTPPLVVGVTVLTSVSSHDPRAVARQVASLSTRAARAGLDGVVASAGEARAVRRCIGPDRRIVCPGIRPAGAARGDQARVFGPREAIVLGADFLVVGRPITEAPDPAAAARTLIRDLYA